MNAVRGNISIVAHLFAHPACSPPRLFVCSPVCCVFAQGGTWRPASQEALAGRTIIKARRKGISAPTGVAMPAFNFGTAMPANPFAGLAAPQPPAAAAAAAASPSPAPAPAPAAVASPEAPAAGAAAPLNALERLAAAQKSSSWTCPTCETPNKLTDLTCGACEEPKPAVPTVVAAAPLNPLQELQRKIAASSWECAVCMTANKMADKACASCQEPRPAGKGDASSTDTAAAPAAAAPVTFSFGSAAPAASSSSAATGTGLSFGSAPLSFGGAVTFGGAPASTGAVSFGSAPTFGATAPAATVAAAPTPFSFGGAAEAPASSEGTFGRVPSFSFGGAALGGATPATFGSVASAPASFGSDAASSSSSAAATPAPAPQFEASSAEALASAGTEVSREFRNATKESTGEEHDEVHLRVNTKVYQIKKVPIIKPAPEPTGELAAAAAGGAAPETPLVGGTPVLDADGQVKTEQKYVEIGTGELHINTFADPATGKTRARMVLREAATKRSVLNAPVFAGMVYSVQGERMVRFHSLDLDGKFATFMMKVSAGETSGHDAMACDRHQRRRLCLRFVRSLLVSHVLSCVCCAVCVYVCVLVQGEECCCRCGELHRHMPRDDQAGVNGTGTQNNRTNTCKQRTDKRRRRTPRGAVQFRSRLSRAQATTTRPLLRRFVAAHKSTITASNNSCNPPDPNPSTSDETETSR